MNAFLADFAEPYQWAAEYRRLGLQVVPGKAGEKRPLMSWVEFQTTLVPQPQFDRWYGLGGEFRMNRQMGMLTGLCSPGGLEGGSGLLVVDLDSHDGPNGLDWWRALVETHFNGIEPETWRAVSGGGGVHIFFAGLAGRRCPTFKRPDLGVDARGQGGYIVVAPSIHPNGNAYEWVSGFEPWSIPLAWAAPELHDALDALSRPVAGVGAPRELTPTPASQTGLRQDDGRESKLAALVWAAVVDLRRDSPIRPSEAVQGAELSRLWDHYELTTRSRLPLDGRSNAERLEAEGRGFSELRAKWQYAMLQWDGKVAEAAKVPKSEPELNGWGEGLRSTLDKLDPRAAADWTGEATFEGLGLSRLSEVKALPAPRRWLVEGWVPQGEVTLLSSDGGLGKSLLALQLACSAAVGSSWLGLGTAKASSLVITCEDDQEEISRRFWDVRAALGYALSAPFEPVVIGSRRHKENRLTQRGAHSVLGLGPFHPELGAILSLVAPDLLILDTLADFYTGNENDRSEVSWFIKAVLGGLIAQSEGHLTVLTLGHVSKAKDSEFSGSTAWGAAVRSRLFLHRDQEWGPTERRLTREKANYAGGDDNALNLMWEEGAFRCLGGSMSDDMAQLVQTVVNAVEYAFRTGRAYTSERGSDRNIHRALVGHLTSDAQTPDAIREALKRAQTAKLIEKKGGEWRKRGQT